MKGLSLPYDDGAGALRALCVPLTAFCQNRRADASKSCFGLRHLPAVFIPCLVPGGGSHARRDDRRGVCRPGVGRLLCRFRRTGLTCVDKDPAKIEALRRGEMPIFEPGLPRAGREERARAPPVLHDRPAAARAGGRRGLHRRRHAVPPRRRPCRPLLRLCSAAREIAGRHRRLHGGRHQVDRAGRHRRRGRADHPRGAARCRLRRRLEPGIPARRRGDRRLQAPGPDRHRHRGRARPAT